MSQGKKDYHRFATKILKDVDNLRAINEACKLPFHLGFC
ncbi:hypothetical protein SAMN05216334_103109 [Nitrosomonas ureae]|uniref:Uncharacterized protein n=1 Tax=Nitrosomonas ureae TaxID=44577 RepID=A0A1H5SVB8_9PROT|nr:hypothetical protein SAMN05216334_103109 [Nitrosomonas ureae]